ncbi:DUF6475 domain-containing protein [Xylophilus sp. Leaf220]|uniref:DUF6475 domain-containing protein n=1 Tax=Xylophilus sp. Leaf220 TaxID=1735686 RepID=UPI0006FB1790|nr:DUF6475 domain-containing protein [Xylophilus sp. Leaf220]KQM72961.1 hypothetical protein ASE76_19475 [Xylophilus sp. Leaf220]
MREQDLPEFSALISGVMAYHRQAVSAMIIGVWWRACQRWTLEQVRHAIDEVTTDPEAGKYPPKIGDLTRVLEGTRTERAALAWGKVLEAMGAVGAYTDVVFDDAAIHAVVEDLGGWPKLCRTETAELGYVQHRFCESHKAYVGRGAFDYPRRLGGDRSPDDQFKRRGLPPPLPALVGDPDACERVAAGGCKEGKTPISFKALATLASAQAPARGLPGATGPARLERKNLKEEQHAAR